MFGLGFLSGPLPLSLAIDSPHQVVGGKATYRLQGAPPGATLAWSSYKDGKATGEFNAAYAGQAVEANGTLELTSEAWRPEDAGVWRKIVAVLGANGQVVASAIVEFVVQGAAPANPSQPYAQPSGSALFYLGDFAVTPGLALGGLALLYLLTKGK